MIQLETLSGKPYDTIYLKETDSKYGDILEHIKKPEYTEYNPSEIERYTMYIKTDIKLFNKGQLINFDDDISFDKEDCVLQIFIKYEYICYDNYNKIYNFIEENLKEQIINLIKHDGRFLNLLREEEQTEEICKLSVQKNGCALKYVKIEQTEEICKLAFQQNGWLLQYVKNQTEEICKLAVQQYGNALYGVKNQTEEICKLAVQQYGTSLRYVKNKTEELCKLAVQKDGDALDYVPESMKHLFM